MFFFLPNSQNSDTIIGLILAKVNNLHVIWCYNMQKVLRSKKLSPTTAAEQELCD